MNRVLQLVVVILLLIAASGKVKAQNNQSVTPGSVTNAVHFQECVYQWTNDLPGIGLRASGTGDIPSFSAINNTKSSVTAHITATPLPTGFAYISNSGSANVSVINTATNTVVATIPVGGTPLGVTVSKDNKRVYVANVISGNVSVINTATNQVVNTFATGITPYCVALSPDGSILYVANNNDDNISVINTATGITLTKIAVGRSPYAIAINPEGSRVYVAHEIMANSVIDVINTANNTLLTSITVGVGPEGVVVSPDGETVYTTNVGTSTVTVIDAQTNKVTKVIPVGDSPEGIAISPDGSKVYAGNWAAGTVSVISTASGSVIATIRVGLGPTGLSASPDGKAVYVTNANDNSVSVIDVASGKVTAVVPVGVGPCAQGTFVTSAVTCQPVSFTITVAANPNPPIINAGTVTGTISACRGTASASPNVKQFIVTGKNLLGAIKATASAGFEISQSNSTGYAQTLSMPQINGIASSTVIYVRSAASASGSISGSVVLSSAEATSVNIPVTGQIDLPPSVDPVAPLTVISGRQASAINFTGTGTDFTWINNTPGIGLAASGSGNIPSFKAINNGTNPITATITVTPASPGYAYIPNLNSANVSVINTATKTLKATIAVGPFPTAAAVSPDQHRVYIANSGFGLAASLSVIDVSNNKVIADIPVGLNATDILCSPDGSRVYVVNENSENISVIDVATNKVAATFTTGHGATSAVINADGSTLYVTNSGLNNVWAINTLNGQQIAAIPVGPSPYGIAISPDGSTLYVANESSNNVSVINIATNKVTATIPTDLFPYALCVSPDGSTLYVSNNYGNTVSVINTASLSEVTRIPSGQNPAGVLVSPDGNYLYVANTNSNDVAIFNTQTNDLVTRVAAGNNPQSFGNFISRGSNCDGLPRTFTITVLPLVPTIVAGTLTGNIATCTGSPGSSPLLEQFSASGFELSSPIEITAPAGFELSLSTNGGFTSSLQLPPTAAVVSNTIVYVRCAATAVPGTITGNVNLASTGVASQNIPVNATIVSLPVVNPVAGQIVQNGSATTAINYSGTGSTYSWVNNTPGIGLAASGQGNIPPFNAINNGSSPIVATITVIPGSANGSGCDGAAVSFTITVKPSPPPVISIKGELTRLFTIYGSPSSTQTFTISGSQLKGNVTVNAPEGFEISTDDQSFSSSVIIGGPGTLTVTTLYIRLAAVTSAGTYTGTVTFSSSGTASQGLTVPASTVTPATLTITAQDKTKYYRAENPPLTAMFSGFVNNDSPEQLTIQPMLNTAVTSDSPPGNYLITVSGAASPNYSINFQPGTFTVIALPPKVTIPNVFTPNGDGSNDTWVINTLNEYPLCIVSVFNRYGLQVFKSTGYAKPWNGAYNETPVPAGTYYYLVDLKNGSPVLSGAVTVLR